MSCILSKTTIRTRRQANTRKSIIMSRTNINAKMRERVSKSFTACNYATWGWVLHISISRAYFYTLSWKRISKSRKVSFGAIQNTSSCWIVCEHWRRWWTRIDTSKSYILREVVRDIWAFLNTCICGIICKCLCFTWQFFATRNTFSWSAVSKLSIWARILTSSWR